MTESYAATLRGYLLLGLVAALLAACTAASAPPTATPTLPPLTAPPAPLTVTPLRPTTTVAPLAAAPSSTPGGATRPAAPGVTLADLPEAQKPMWAGWRTGPHANTYSLEKGPNTFCARCHSPMNYDAASKVDPPPNCVSCKFPTDPRVRVAEHNRLVPENEWRSIGCEVCHRVENGAIFKGIAWRDPATGQYQAIASATDLCERCHTDTETLRHKRDLGQAAHRGFTCVSCHDPHSTQASCTAAGCHPGPGASLTPPPGHDPAHATVNCVACHDASGMQVGRVKETGLWTTWRTTELLGRKTTSPALSHSMQRQVDCSRCHFAGNGWGLSEIAKPKP